MLSINKSLICVALPLATLTACGGGGGGGNDVATSKPTPVVTKATISTTNAKALSKAVLTNGNLSSSSFNLFKQIQGLATSSQARSASGSESCPQTGSMSYSSTSDSNMSVTFHGCEVNDDLSLNGGFDFSMTGQTSAPLVKISYKALNVKMAANTNNNYQALDDTLNGTFSMQFIDTATATFTTEQNLKREENQSGFTTESNNVKLAYANGASLPTAASGSIKHSVHGEVSLAMQEQALLIQGENSTLKIEMQGASYVLSLDEDNNGTFEQRSLATQLGDEALVWKAI
ncbi:hypothetical protein K6Y31_17465 [Motilimonas cestriensis]|uniref:Lipoprotein n=1 Tax=Motilimonas cestriensis TaxID=2742685 RepID=A0ABS8WE90_9GAMM|nr:hypothetical protein [Motilimonas cestriensis]MCE2596580.1 hypothetical protein [Motilimonas cestriensis]